MFLRLNATDGTDSSAIFVRSSEIVAIAESPAGSKIHLRNHETIEVIEEAAKVSAFIDEQERTVRGRKVFKD